MQCANNYDSIRDRVWESMTWHFMVAIVNHAWTILARSEFPPECDNASHRVFYYKRLPMGQKYYTHSQTYRRIPDFHPIDYKLTSIYYTRVG